VSVEFLLLIADATLGPTIWDFALYAPQ